MAPDTNLTIQGTVATTAEEQEAPETPEEVWTTEVRGTADDYKKLGEVFLTVLAALPTATLVSTLIRAPGKEGLDESDLFVGLFCAVAAVFLGLALAIWLRAPARATEDEIRAVKLETIIGAMPGTGADLIDTIRRLQSSNAEGDQRTRNQAALARERGVLKHVQEIATVDHLRARVASFTTFLLAGLALILAATSVGHLALAPKPEAKDPPAPTTSVVTYRLTETGIKELGCPSETLTALKIAGSDTEPQVIPLGVDCAAGPVLQLNVDKQKSASEADVVEARPSVAPATGAAGLDSPSGDTSTDTTATP